MDGGQHGWSPDPSGLCAIRSAHAGRARGTPTPACGYWRSPMRWRACPRPRPRCWPAWNGRPCTMPFSASMRRNLAVCMTGPELVARSNSALANRRRSRKELPAQLQASATAGHTQLSPVERIWLYLLESCLSHRVLDNYEAVLDADCGAWNKLRNGDGPPHNLDGLRVSHCVSNSLGGYNRSISHVSQPRIVRSGSS